MASTLPKIPEGRFAVLSLGGNIGDVTKAFSAALAALAACEEILLLRQSSVWRTRPWGVTGQPDFLNIAVALETTLTPDELLLCCQEIERQAGRERDVRWGPRTLDIDIIFFDGLELNSDRLQLPHPHAHERIFVLAPMAEIASDVQLRGRAVADWLADFPSQTADSGAVLDPVATGGLLKDK